MFPQQYRLNLREEKDFFRKARLIHSPSCILYVVGGDKDISQMAIVIKSGVLKTAVDRNRTKRILRPLLLPYLTSIQKKKCVLVYKSTQIPKKEKLEQELTFLFSKIDHFGR